MRSKLVLGLLFAVAAMLFVVVPPATAKSGNGATEATQYTQTNVPYLAWIGEEVRLVKCYDPPVAVGDSIISTSDIQAALTSVDFNVLQWTGTSDKDPLLEPGSVTAFTNGRQLCVRGDFVSLHPGLATIEMDATVDWGALYKGHDGLMTYPKHMFLAAWMTMVKPTLTEISNAGLTGFSANQDLGANGAVVNLLHGNYSSPITPAAVPTKGVMLGDPKGDGNFYPIADANGVNHLYDGLMSVRVKGQFPDAAAPGGMWTMPDNWAAFAAVYETDSLGIGPSMWDIHNSLSWDPNALTEGSIVDPTAIGPFDPLIWSTLLPNLKLDAGDAPMPAARVDFSIAPGGVGGFDPVSKQWVYIGDATLPAASPNLYAPFYSQYIPATDRPDWTASGIDGPATGNDFVGFLVDGQYTNWAFEGNTTPLDPLRASNPNQCKDEYGNIRVSPAGVNDTVSVYTDEHGEAIVAYNPDKGFYFKAGDNKTCDLGVNVPDNATASTPSTPVLLGSSSITATGVYPYKPVAPVSQTVPSNTIVKNVYGDPAKFMHCVAKDNRTDEMFCVEVIRDLYGNPVGGAKVQFTAQPGAKLVAASLKLGGFDTTGQGSWGTPDDTTVYALTNANGQAGVEVISTLKGQVDLLAENINTRNGGSGITRDACITYSGTGVPTATYAAGGCAGTGTPITPPSSGGSSGSGGTGSSSSGSTSSSPSGTTHHVVALKLLSAKLVVTHHGRYLQVKVQSPKKTAVIKVTLVGKHHKTLRVVSRKVAANKSVRVRNLTIGKNVRTVKVILVR